MSDLLNTSPVAEASLTPDHIQKLAPYLAAVKDIDGVNETNAPKLLSELSQGLVIASNLVGAAAYRQAQAKTILKKVKALHYMEKFPEYIAQQADKGIKVKDTEDSREHFLNAQPEILAATDEYNYYCAVYEQVSGMKMSLTMALSSAKAVVYGNRASDSLSSFAN